MARPSAWCSRRTCAIPPTELGRATCRAAAAAGRRSPLTIRLVKGAYWDHEVVEARTGEVDAARSSTEKPDSDRNFEALSRRLVDRALQSPGAAAGGHRIAQHPLNRARCRVQPPRWRGQTPSIELQVLRGLGDDLAQAISGAWACAREATARSATSWPGMAYLVRRLLENTANESFLAQRAKRPRALDELLAAP